MKNQLIENKKIIEEKAIKLWKGNGADIGEISKAIHSTAEIIIGIAENLSDEDRIITIQYINNGLKDFEKAYNNRDDFLLADCLYYVWREIIIIYAEALEE